MGIRKTFKSSWEQGVLRAVTNEDIEVIPDQRCIIDPVYMGNVMLAEHVVLYGEYSNPCLVTTRFSQPCMSIAALFHIWKQKKRLLKDGISSSITFTGGVVSCTYTKQDWLQHLLQSSSASQFTPEQQTTSAPTME